MNNPNNQILRLALPSIVTNVTVPLLGMADMAIVGHIGDAVYIGAIAVGSMVFNLIYWVFGFLRMGTSGMTAQARGARDFAGVITLLIRSVKVALLVSALILVAQVPLRWVSFWLIDPSPEIVPLATLYFDICVWGAPAMMVQYAVSGWYIGMQNTRVPMLVAVFQNIVNIAASLLAVFVLKMKVDGIALGTVVAQYAGAAVSLLLWMNYYRKLWSYRRQSPLDSRRLSFLAFFRVNRDIFLRTLFLVMVNFLFLSVGASQGTLILAVNTLLMQFYILFSYVMDGFAFAGEALGGRYWGAGNAVSFKSVVRRLFAWGCMMVFLFTLSYVALGQVLVGLLTSDTAVVEASHEFFPWVLAIPAAGMAAFVWDGVFIGVTATRGMLAATFFSAVLFILTYSLLHTFMGNHALWLSFILFLLMRGCVQTFWFFRRLSPC